MNHKPKIFRLTTVSVSMNIILKGQLAYMHQYFDVTGITSPDAKHFPEIAKREGIRMIPLSIARTIHPWQDLKTLFQLYLLFSKEKPDIVHTHTPKAGLLGMTAAWLARVPVRLHTVGGIPWMEITGWKKKILRFTEKITYAFADKVYPNSKGLQTFILKEKICESEKLKVLANGGSNGIDATYFSPDYTLGKKTRETYTISDDELVLGFVGRIAREKGISEFLDAFRRLKRDYKVKMVLVGLFERTYGGLDPETEQRILHDPDILFLGRFDDVRPFYAMTDIFVFPSYREGFPNAVLEACAMGVPVVATDINGCNEIIENNINGLLVSPKSSEELYQALLRLFKDTSLRAQLGKKAREQVVRLFRRELIWEALKKEYDFFLEKEKKSYSHESE